MPELPEIETIKGIIEPQIQSLTVEKVTVSRPEVIAYPAAIPERLSHFIEVDKMTSEEYLETKGRDYRNTPCLQVYGKEGRSCPRCGAALCRIIVGGRSSVYCPACQNASV